MLYHSISRPFILAVISVILISCGDDSAKNSEPIIDDYASDSIKLSEELGLDSGEAKIFTMPTPLQTASALQVMGVEYQNSLLLGNKLVTSKSDINLSLSLGMYMVDLGYCTVYNSPQKALDYAKDVQEIMEQLPIAYYVNNKFKTRFKNNINSRDSLCKIILQGYNDANQYITETENEGIGLLILTGAYIESFYLITNSKIDAKWQAEYNSMIIQQKQFVDNFLTLLAPYQVDDEINEVYVLLSELNHTFDGIEINFNDKKQAYELVKPIGFEKRNEMKTDVLEIRNSLVKRMKDL